MRKLLLVSIIILPALAGCNVFARQLPTPVPATSVPTVELPTATPSPTATATPVPSPVPSATLPPATQKPSGGTSGITSPAPRRIEFQTGAITATIQGSLGTNSIDYYVLRALGGQKMTVVATTASSQAHLLLQISGADGSPLKSMAAGAPNWTGVLPSTQDYLIAIAAEGGVPASYTLQVTIPPLGK